MHVINTGITSLKVSVFSGGRLSSLTHDSTLTSKYQLNHKMHSPIGIKQTTKRKFNLHIPLPSTLLPTGSRDLYYNRFYYKASHSTYSFLSEWRLKTLLSLPVTIEQSSSCFQHERHDGWSDFCMNNVTGGIIARGSWGCNGVFSDCACNQRGWRMRTLLDVATDFLEGLAFYETKGQMHHDSTCAVQW
eukprot:Gb_13446 [translate_table: standard]